MNRRSEWTLFLLASTSWWVVFSFIMAALPPHYMHSLRHLLSGGVCFLTVQYLITRAYVWKGE